MTQPIPEGVYPPPDPRESEDADCQRRIKELEAEISMIQNEGAFMARNEDGEFRSTDCDTASALRHILIERPRGRD